MSLPLITHTHGSGSDLVLLHGWGLNSGVWQGVLPQLTKQFRVTLLDLPGYGNNHNQVPDVYHLDRVSDLVAQHLPDNCILLGWSMGGLIAQQIALRHPEKLSKLVLVASTPKFKQADDWKGLDATVLQVFETQLARDFSKTLERFLAIQALGSATAKQDIKQLKQQIERYPAPNSIALHKGLQILAETDLRDEISHIRVPIVRLYGRLDSLVSTNNIEQIEQLAASQHMHVFSKASHAPFISHPSEFVLQASYFE